MKDQLPELVFAASVGVTAGTAWWLTHYAINLTGNLVGSLVGAVKCRRCRS